MIYSLTGKLIHVENALAVVECAGVGYACKTTRATLGALPSVGSAVTLYTHLNVREDAVELFGFYTGRELECFRQLQTVSGVGPKAALAILSELTPDRFALAVASGDVKAITRAAGVGPKLAQRVILELKDRVTSEEIASGFSEGAGPAAAFSTGSMTEAVSALTALGYSQSEAAQALGGLDPSLSAEELIRRALRGLAGGKR
ncbi:MAG: Holliday junction branch migration protein RuvA [Oscillospiraceae bacterium]|nr:Holliday junction branch migration protein RuvA [Oscillospiraceae bacterium]